MSDTKGIQSGAESLGELTEEQGQILYNISLRQDELGRQPTNVLASKVEEEPYATLIEREMLTCQLYDHGGSGAPKVASLIVTLKGMRYCIDHADELAAARKWDVAGSPREH